MSSGTARNDDNFGDSSSTITNKLSVLQAVNQNPQYKSKLNTKTKTKNLNNSVSLFMPKIIRIQNIKARLLSLKLSSNQKHVILLMLTICYVTHPCFIMSLNHLIFQYNHYKRPLIRSP